VLVLVAEGSAPTLRCTRLSCRDVRAPLPPA
jgi:hypothetical protein